MFGNEYKTMSIVAACLALFFAANALAVENPIPKEISEINMGSSLQSVQEKLNSPGATHVDSKTRRPKLIWTMPEESYYKDIEFQFTEKDRLFLIHFVLKGTRRDDFQELKKAFMNKYNVSWDEPMRMRIRDSDVLFYEPEKGDVWFLEFTDKNNGDKAIELFDKRILAQDRTAYENAKKAEAEEANKVKAQEEEKKDVEPAAADQSSQPSPVAPQPPEGESPKAPQ